MYGLYAVLVHSGYSCHAGHYYCYVKVRGSGGSVWRPGGVVCVLPPGRRVRRGRLAVPVCTAPGGPSLNSGKRPCFVVTSRSYCCCFMEHKDILLTCPTQFGPTFEGLVVRHKGGCFWYPVLRPLKKSQKAICWWERLCQADLPKDPSGGKACILAGSRKDGGAQHTWGGIFRLSYLAFLCEIIGKDLDAGKD